MSFLICKDAVFFASLFPMVDFEVERWIVNNEMFKAFCKCEPKRISLSVFRVVYQKSCLRC